MNISIVIYINVLLSYLYVINIYYYTNIHNNRKVIYNFIFLYRLNKMGKKTKLIKIDFLKI